MSLYEATFRVRHECPYRTISERHPDLTIREWFMHERQILEVTAPGTPTDELEGALDELGTTLFLADDIDHLYAVVRSGQCSLDDSLIARFEAHNCLYMPPTVYQKGWEHYTVTAFDAGDVRRLLGELDRDRHVDVVSTNPIDARHVPHGLFTTTDALFDGLTSRQLESLRIALDNGYFDQPRGASVEELARETNVSRSTFEEHLRKAENKLIGNTENLIRLLTADQSQSGLRAERPPAASS